jgi:hypothetical protein
MRLFRDDVTIAQSSRRASAVKLPRLRAHAWALVVASALPVGSHALGLGKIVGEPVLGESLQLTIPLTGSVDRPMDNECVVVRRPPDSIDAEYYPRDLQARIETQAGVRLLVLSTRSALRQPLVEFRVSISCGYNLSHDYLLMASPRSEAQPATRSPSRPASAEAPIVTAATGTAAADGKALPDGLSAKSLTIDRDLTLEELARQQFPGPLRRERFMRWVAEANPELFAGVADIRRHRLQTGQKLLVPVGVPPRRPGDHQSAPASADIGGTAGSPAPAGKAAPATADKLPTKGSGVARRDRLVIGAEGSGARDFKETLALVDRLTGMLEQQVTAQSANDQRIRSLESMLAELTGHVAQVETAARQREAQWQKEREEQRRLLAEHPDQGWLQLLIAIVLGGAVGAGLLQAYRVIAGRRQSATAPAGSIPATDNASAEALPPAWDEMLASADDGPVPAAPMTPAAPPSPTEFRTSAPHQPAGALDWQPEPNRSPVAAADMDFPIEFEPPTPTGASMAPPAGVATARPNAMSVEPAPSDPAAAAIELANIMMSMGLAESAAQTLVDHIRENPRQSLHHWLKLLELYRINGNRESFEASAQELRQHFNVQAAEWETAAGLGSRDTIEAYAHLRTHLIKLWRQPDCVTFLQTLLLDNRDGTRAGFPLPVAEEILLLIAIQSSQP